MLLPLLLASVLAGCGPATQQVVRPAVEAGVEEATERDVAKEVEQLLSTPEMREALQKLAQALLAGAREDLGRAEWEAVLHARSADLVEGMAPALARSLETDIGPAVRRELALSVQRALAELATPGSQAQLADVARAVTTAVTYGLIDGLRVPATDPAADPAAVPAVAERPPLRRATEHLVLGVGDALEGDFGEALHTFLRRERAAIYEELAWSTEPLRVALDVLLVVLLPVALVLGLLLRRKARAARRHDRAARLLARACADPAALDALLARVEIDGDADLARYLRRLAGRG